MPETEQPTRGNMTAMLGPETQILIRITRMEEQLSDVREEVGECKGAIDVLRNELVAELRAGRHARERAIELFFQPKIYAPTLVIVAILLAGVLQLSLQWGDLSVNKSAEASHVEHAPPVFGVSEP